MIRLALPLALELLAGAATAQEGEAAPPAATAADRPVMDQGAMDHGSTEGGMGG